MLHQEENLIGEEGQYPRPEFMTIYGNRGSMRDENRSQAGRIMIGVDVKMGISLLVMMRLCH
jgi:hypothetical protein